MKKKKILNIFVTMFIASNLMTNFIYANPVNSETEITNLDETDETDETTNNNDPNVADSNDGFNDGSDDIHYDGNEDYSFLNENGEIDETDKTNKAEDLGILKKDILFEYAYHHRNSDEDYYTSNLNEKIKDFLISKNIDKDKVVSSNVQYDKNKKLFFVFLKVLEDGQNYFQYEFLPNKEYKLYFDTNYYYLTLQDKTLINLTEHDYKNRIFNYIKRKYNFKKITDYSDNNDIKEDTDLNKLYIQATVTTESNENKNIKIYFDALAIPTILNENYDEKFSLSENEIENQELNEENTNKLKNLIKTLKNPLVNKDLNINEPVKIEKEIVNTETNINKTRYYVVADSSDGNKHKIFLEEKNNEIDNTDYDDISDENVDNLPYFYQSKEVYYSYYFKRKYDNAYSSSLTLDRNDYEKLLTYTREIFNKELEFDTQNRGPRIYFGKKMAYINGYDSELNKSYKIPIKGPEKLIFNSSCFNIPKDKEIPEDIMNKITNWYKENIINMKDIVFMNRNIQSETVDGKVEYYYDIEITKNNGSKKQDKLYLKTNSKYDNKDIYEEKVNNLIYLDSSILKNQRKLNEEEKEFILNILRNEIADNIMNGVDNFEIQNDDVNKDENGYYIDLIVNTLKNETFNVKLYIYEKEDITLKTLIPISNINIDNLYIDNNHTYVYQFGGQNDYGISLKKYIENKLENGEIIASIEKNIVNGKHGVSFVINKNGNYSRTINVIVEKEMNISDGMKFGGQTHPILLENSAINRETNENDKENILKMLRQIYPAAIKDINIVSNISMKYVHSSELGRNFLVDTPYVVVQIIPYGDEINENINIEKYKNGFESYDDLIGTKDNNYLVVFVNESPLPEPACPPSMTDELGTPVIECKISNSSGCCGCGNPNKPIVPVDPNDYPNVPNPPTPSEDIPKPENPVTPSDLPKPKPNDPITPNPRTPNTVVPKEPNTIVPKEPNKIVPNDPTQITIITNKTNEDVTNKNNPTTLSETKPVTRNIKTGDNLFFMLSLFSGMLSLFSFISIILSKRKSI